MEAGVRIYGVRELVLNLQALGADVERASKNALWKAGVHLERVLKQKLNQPGTGKTWPKRGIKKGKRYGFHTASVPGQPPAPDEGRLKGSVTHNVTGRPGTELPDPGGSRTEARGYVGTNMGDIGASLEFGVDVMHPFGNYGLISSIEPRPWLYITVNENANEVAKVVSDSLKEAIKKARAK